MGFFAKKKENNESFVVLWAVPHLYKGSLKDIENLFKKAGTPLSNTEESLEAADPRKNYCRVLSICVPKGKVKALQSMNKKRGVFVHLVAVENDAFSATTVRRYVRLIKKGGSLLLT